MFMLVLSIFIVWVSVNLILLKNIGNFSLLSFFYIPPDDTEICSTSSSFSDVKLSTCDASLHCDYGDSLNSSLETREGKTQQHKTTDNFNGFEHDSRWWPGKIPSESSRSPTCAGEKCEFYLGELLGEDTGRAEGSWAVDGRADCGRAGGTDEENCNQKFVQDVDVRSFNNINSSPLCKGNLEWREDSSLKFLDSETRVIPVKSPLESVILRKRMLLNKKRNFSTEDSSSEVPNSKHVKSYHRHSKSFDSFYPENLSVNCNSNETQSDETIRSLEEGDSNGFQPRPILEAKNNLIKSEIFHSYCKCSKWKSIKSTRFSSIHDENNTLYCSLPSIYITPQLVTLVGSKSLPSMYGTLTREIEPFSKLKNKSDCVQKVVLRYHGFHNSSHSHNA